MATKTIKQQKAFEKKSDKDLVSMLNEKREEIRGARFRASGSPIRDANTVRLQRKEVARILTEINARAHSASTDVA